ncbi:MAG: 23S rRNA (adenine(2503)-C(2))-methyltransferase RlmN [Phycisphaerales bacterium]
MNHIFDHTPDSLAAWCAAHAMPPFRATQILDWVYRRGVIDPAAMTNLSIRDRDTLARDITFLSGHTLAHQLATDGTQKLLIQWNERGSDEATERRSDGEASQAARQRDSETGAGRTADPINPATRLTILSPSLPTPDTSRQTECVMIPSLPRDDDDSGGPGLQPGSGPDRRTACISSQVGCPVGCRFCASGLGGLDANLSTGRIVEQVWRLRHILDRYPVNPTDLPRITNVVFMGMGEPLSNFRAVTSAIRTIAAPWGHAISARKITISTVGMPRAIERLAEEFDLPVTLALSLHAPTDAIRRSLIPWAEYSTIEQLLAACQKWFAKTGREVTLEYTLLASVNDRPEHAAELARLAKTLRANINLIRYNEVAGMPFNRPATADVRAFQDILRARGVNAHIRASRGRDIAAACGQLRHETAGAGA